MSESTTFDLSDDDFSAVEDPTPEPSDDGKVTCPDCNGRYTLTKAGAIRSHNCNGVKTVTRSSTPKTRGKRAKKSAPANVIRLGAPAMASGVDFVTKRVVARAVPCELHEVPPVVEIPDDDTHTIFDPLINILWPQMPGKVQGVIESICNHEDAILAVMAMAEHWERVSTVIQVMQSQRRTETGTGYGIPQQTSESGDGLGYGAIVPFQPVTPGTASM